MSNADSNSSVSSWPGRIANSILAVIGGICAGIAAGAIQQAGVAPFGILSLAVGALLGFVLVGAASVMKTFHPGWGFAVVASAAAVVTQHVWLYRADLVAREKALHAQPEVALFKPGWTEESFWSYLHTEATFPNVSLWLVDALLLALAAMVIVKLSNKNVEREDEGPR